MYGIHWTTGIMITFIGARVSSFPFIFPSQTEKAKPKSRQPEPRLLPGNHQGVGLLPRGHFLVKVNFPTTLPRPLPPQPTQQSHFGKISLLGLHWPVYHPPALIKLVWQASWCEGHSNILVITFTTLSLLNHQVQSHYQLIQINAPRSQKNGCGNAVANSDIVVPKLSLFARVFYPVCIVLRKAPNSFAWIFFFHAFCWFLRFKTLNHQCWEASHSRLLVSYMQPTADFLSGGEQPVLRRYSLK